MKIDEYDFLTKQNLHYERTWKNISTKEKPGIDCDSRMLFCYCFDSLIFCWIVGCVNIVSVLNNVGLVGKAFGKVFSYFFLSHEVQRLI